MHRVVVLAVPPVTTFDLAIPEMVFPAVRVDDVPVYEVVVCTADPGIVPGYTGRDVVVECGLDQLETADTVIVTGTGARGESDPRVLTALRAAADAGTRITSICTGAFVLAQAGLLDGRPATTYWLYSAEMRARFPAVDLRPDVLFVDDGEILTSAGLAAGLDLCVHIVRRDHGAAVANAVARLAVVAPLRPGGQAQFIENPLPPETGTSLAETRAWALARLDEPLTLRELAAHAHISIRTLTRRFRAETGSSPLQWLLHQRIDRARELLEVTDLPVPEVARRSGLGTGESLRLHLTRRHGLTPSAYRTAFSRK
ncbi:helix-turn-helix domain-containing protein [Nocardia puris]|uniref:AraC family transcriptional regulator with amidase-like domain n=1 Tax=Nocardia puris TaxID=208602 RepID=A0A366DBS1_9NOCA|nr:helix-turn-helix domain-containing protein [Nocardia puris]MBF6211700.1 helix-turn-helix domain-containing protein [Nocardia puris]MBF6365704.1 helix-turn-helix domain-containing protein [Nocardia puris]MBF6460654.1 helix-turn-helix domain-containing protein [Nocardia puris]RBO86874.1 AraC family transcriptional regulator with amidase-like domain [Nocardia puris]